MRSCGMHAICCYAPEPPHFCSKLAVASWHASLCGLQACRVGVQALQCLVNILRSLVEWYTAGMPAEQPNQGTTAQSVGEDNVQSWENLTSSGPSQLFNEVPTDDKAEPGSPLRPTLRRDTSVLQSMMMSTGTLVSIPLALRRTCARQYADGQKRMFNAIIPVFCTACTCLLPPGFHSAELHNSSSCSCFFGSMAGSTQC